MKFAAYSVAYTNIDGEAQTPFIGPDCVMNFVKYVAQTAKDVATQVLKNGQITKLVVVGFNSHRFDAIYLLPKLFKVFGDSVNLVGSCTDIKILSIKPNI